MTTLQAWPAICGSSLVRAHFLYCLMNIIAVNNCVGKLWIHRLSWLYLLGGAQLMWLIDWCGSIDGIYRLRRLKWYLRLIAWSSSILDGWLNWCDWSIDVINRLMSLIDWCGSISDWLNRCERSIYLPLKYLTMSQLIWLIDGFRLRPSRAEDCQAAALPREEQHAGTGERAYQDDHAGTPGFIVYDC